MANFEKDGFTPCKNMDRAASELLTSEHFMLTVAVRNEKTEKMEMRTYFSSLDSAGTLLEYAKMSLRATIIERYSGEGEE